MMISIDVPNEAAGELVEALLLAADHCLSRGAREKDIDARQRYNSIDKALCDVADSILVR